jgi:hypothetical protein
MLISLAAAQRLIDQLVTAKGPRTIENILAPYDQAFEQINAASNIADLMQQLVVSTPSSWGHHPDI